jgi:hypothetical protein
MEEAITALPRRLAQLARGGEAAAAQQPSRAVPAARAAAYLTQLLHTKLTVHLAALLRAQDAVAAEAAPRPRAHSMLGAFAAALARSAAAPRAAADPGPFWPHAHGTLRLRDADRRAVRNEADRIEAAAERAVARSSLRDASRPAAAAAAAHAAAAASWIHDRLRDGLAWRALAAERPAAVAGVALAEQDRGRRLTATAAAGALPLAAQPPPPPATVRWLQEVYARHVVPRVDAVLEAAPPPTRPPPHAQSPVRPPALQPARRTRCTARLHAGPGVAAAC